MSHEEWFCCAFRIMVFVETISFDIQIKHDFMAFNGHSSSCFFLLFLYINIFFIDWCGGKHKKQKHGFWDLLLIVIRQWYEQTEINCTSNLESIYGITISL